MNFKTAALMRFVAIMWMSAAALAHPLTKLKTVAVAAAAVGAKLGYTGAVQHEHVAHHVAHHAPHHVLHHEEHAVHLAHVHAEPLHHHVHYAPVVHHVEHDVEFEPIIGKPTQPLVNVNDVITLLGAGKRIVKQKAIGLLSALNPTAIVQRVAHVAKAAIEAKTAGVVHEHVVEHVPTAYAHVTNHVEYAPVPVSVW